MADNKQIEITEEINLEKEIQPTFVIPIFKNTDDEKISELKEHLANNGYDVKWQEKDDDNSYVRFTCNIDDKAYIQTILEDRGIDYRYELGLLAAGFDAAWLSEDEQLDAEVVNKAEFKRINEIREKEFKDKKLPYITVDFTEGTTSDHKLARMQDGTVLGLREGEELLKELNYRFNTFSKCDLTVHFPDALENEAGSYNLRYDFTDDVRHLENGKEVPYEREGLSDYIRMTCPYPEVLEKFEEQWQKVNAPNITEEQKKVVADIIAPNFEKLKGHYHEQLENLNTILGVSKKLNSGLIVNASESKASEESIEKEQDAISVSFERYAGRCMNHIADYLDENKKMSFKDEFVNYAKHQISNMLQDVKYGESRNAKFGEHGYDFDFSLWRKSLEKVMDASEYDSFLSERLQTEELRYKKIRNAAKDMGMAMDENLKTKTTFKLSTNSYIDYFVKSTAEFDAFADFEPITNLGVVEAVEKYKELQEKDISCGIGIDIRNDLIFDTPEGSGITVLIRNEDGKDTLNIMGDSFIKELKYPDQHSLDVILAFEGIYNEAKKQGLNIEESPYIEEKKQELFGNLQKTTLVNGDIVVNSDTLPGTNRAEEKIINNIEIKPVLLEEILDIMEMRPEVTPEGKIKVFDLQRKEYIDNHSDLSLFDEDNWTFSNAGEIFERLDVYINDYYVHDMQEQLEDSGIKITGNETLSDLCSLYKIELEKGNDKLSLGELNLAMGIVEPDTVIMREKDIVQNKSNIHDEKINYVLEKLAKAGIEVVTDKEEFDRILGREAILQKMSGSLSSEEQKRYFTFDEEDSQKFHAQIDDGTTYGFIHEGKIYLNPDVMNSNAAVHEYTHLWDAYTQKTNPELWQKGLNIFKNTFIWKEVIEDENYADIKHNENLVLSECHARICGKIADTVLQKVFEKDGDLKKTEMIDWDSETWEYIGTEFRTAAIKVLEAETKEFSFNNTKDFLEQFLSTPMKDLFVNERKLEINQKKEEETYSLSNEEFPKVFTTPKSLGLSEKEHFAYYQYELSLKQIKTIVSAESDIVKMVEKNTDSPEKLDVYFVFDREHNKLFDFYIRYNKNNNTYTSSYVAGEVRKSDISKNMQENLCKIFEGVFKMNQEIQTGAAEKVQSESLFDFPSDLPVEELREGLKYALNEVAQPLPEIDFTRENYNKLFPRDRLKTPIETVKIGAHQFEKLEAKDRKNLLQAVHDVLSNPDVIINEEKESIFGDMENSHVYAKSYVINEKTKAVQSVVVNIEDEYISISTHKRDISNVVNKIKKPDQLLFAAAEVRLLAEQHTKEKLSQSVVSPNRENEYVIPPQTNIPQPQEKSSDEISQSFTIKGEKYSFSDAEALLKEDIAAIFEELDSSEIEQNLTLNGVKIYGNPETDGKIKLLVEFDSKNPDNKWSEDSLFNAIGDENIAFNGMEVDINPITPEKSGTIEEYLSHLERLDAASEAEVIEKQAELIASREEIKEDNQIDDVLEQCNKILDKYSNTHFTELEQRYINECETKNDDRHQVLMSLCNMKYVHVTTKDKKGYWEIKKGKEISANEARKLMSYDDFASGIDRASFHFTAGRNANDGSFVYFNDSERKRDIQPYELTKEDYLLLSQYEKAGGSTEIIPEAILQQLLQYNINANIENPNILSWQEIEDYFSARNVRETKNEVLESFTEFQEKPSEKALKEECVARLLENQIDFYGFDTNKTDDKLNSEISVAKWDVLEKIAEKTVSKELDLKPYAAIQEEADELLMENPVFQECIKNGIISEPDFLLKTENKKDIELTAEDIKNAKALFPKEQYQLVLSYTQGEEGEHFKGIIKEISSKAETIKGKREILTEEEKHPLAFKYTLGNSRFYFSEWDGEDELFGYAVLNGDTQNSEWGYTSLKELKNAGGRDGTGFPVLPEMTFYGLEDTIEKQVSVDYPELSEQMGFSKKKNHNEQLVSEFGKEILEALDSRKLEPNAYNICCAAQFVLRSMDSSERKEVISIMEKCGCQGKYGKENTEDFLTDVVNSERKTASAVYTRNNLYERINKACPSKKPGVNKDFHSPENDFDDVER